MDRYAIFVDAGYLMAQAIRILHGKKGVRSELQLSNPAKLMQELKNHAESAFKHDRLLRIYWYDGVGTTMTEEQVKIALLPDVLFRSGTIHNKAQKGVDSRIVQDLFELASNHSISDAMVVTGDGDLAVGIDFAQRRGLRVALMSVEDIRSGVLANRHTELLYQADRQLTLGKSEITGVFRYGTPSLERGPTLVVPVATASPPPAVHLKKAPKSGRDKDLARPYVEPEVALSADIDSTELLVADSVLREVTKHFANELPEDARSVAVNSGGGIDALIDKQLLISASSVLKRKLEIEERNNLRKYFLEEISAR